VIGVAGGKGGSGKTTTTVGLAQALAEAGREPLVIDADRRTPDLHLLATVSRAPGLDALANERLDRILHRSPTLPGVAVLPVGDATAPELSAGLRRASSWHGPVLVDCPAGGGRDAARPLRHCDRTVLVTAATPQSVTDTRKTAAVARRLDAPPAALLVRAGPPDTADIDVPYAASIPAVDGDVLSDPRIRTSYRAVARELRATASDGRLTRRE
jgi:septum site-determining protein MinD